MFDTWRRPGREMPPRKGGVTSIAFDSADRIVNHECLSVLGSTSWPHPLFVQFLHGLQLAQELCAARSEKRYAGYHHVVVTTLFVKMTNDLLAATVLVRAGYNLQVFPCLRSSLETAELMEYLHLNPDCVEDYIRARGRFERDTSWIRSELPHPDTRRALYDFLNYLTHPNLKGLNAYTSYDLNDSVSVIQVGPVEPRSALLKPYALAIALLAYGVRTLSNEDPTAVQAGWHETFDHFDESANRFLKPFGP